VDIIQCHDGGYAVNGYYMNYPDEFTDELWSFIMKVDADGNFEWAKRDSVDHPIDDVY